MTATHIKLRYTLVWEAHPQLTKYNILHMMELNFQERGTILIVEEDDCWRAAYEVMIDSTQHWRIGCCERFDASWFQWKLPDEIRCLKNTNAFKPWKMYGKVM